MITRILIFTAFTCFTLAASAQQCTRSMIFFDYGKYDLKRNEQKKIDSVAKAISEGNYVIELSGHCDSNNTEAFNQKLSEQRVNAVEKYLKGRVKKSTVIYKDFPRGELRPMVPNDSEENMAKNRRVDIYVLSPEGDRLVFRGDRNESLEIPLDFPGACSVCEELKLKFIHNDQEAASSGLGAKSSTGRALTTAGGAMFSFECPEKASACLPVKVTMPARPDLRFECLSSWQSARGASWEAGKASLQADRANNAIVATDACYKMGAWTVVSKPLEDICKHQVNFPADFTIMKTKVYAKDSSVFTEAAQMPLTYPCGTSNSMFSWATADGKYFFLKDSWRNVITTAQNTGNCDTLFTYNLTKEKYAAVPVSDTTVFAKFKGFNAVKNVGYYVEELDLLLPLTNVKKTTWSANYLNYDHTLRFQDDKDYKIKYTDVKTKYKSGKKKLKVTVKKKKLPEVTVEAQ